MKSTLRLLPLLAALLALSASAAEKKEPTPLQIEKALEELQAADWILKWAAMSRLARWHATEAVEPIRKIVDGDDHPWVRGRALVALARLLGRKALGEARTHATSSTPQLRAAAIEALGIIGVPEARPLILAAMKDPEPDVRGQAVVALARLDRQGAWEHVRPMLDDENPTIVRHAARALLYVGTAEARERLIALLDHSDAGVRREAAIALGKLLPEEAIPRLLARLATDGDEKVRSACLEALVAYQPHQLAGPMLQALEGEKRDYYGPALKVLTLRPSREACDAVARILADPPRGFHDVIPYALRLLARLEPDRYLQCFARYLENQPTGVTRAAIECLERCKRADLFALLRPILCDEEPGRFLAAFTALERATTGAPPGGIVEYLAEVFRRGQSRARRAAIQLLGERITAPEVQKAIAVLEPVLASQDRETREAAAQAIARVADRQARRRIAAAQGYITRWMLIGPFPRGQRKNPLGPSYFPEHEIALKKTYEPRAWDPAARFRQVEASCGGERRKALLLQPPKGGRLVVVFRLMLPDADGLKLKGALGIQDGARPADGVQFRLQADGKTLLETKLTSPESGWQPFEADLAPWRGKKLVLELSADPLADPSGDQLLVAEPELLAGGRKLLGLLEVADAAPAWVSRKRARDKLAWKPYLIESVDGELPLYDIFTPPITNRVAYALCDLDLPAERKAVLEVEADDGFILWQAGRQVARRTSRGKTKVELTLRAGTNRLLFKVVNYGEWWRLRARLCDKEGRAIRARQ